MDGVYDTIAGVTFPVENTEETMKSGRYIAILVLVLLLGTLIVFRVRSSPSADDPGSNESVAVTLEPTPLVLETPPVELQAVLTAGQLAALDTSALQHLDLTGSRCYEAIEAFIQDHPDVEVVYAVLIDGDGEPMRLDPGTETLEIDDASYLPSLTENALWLHKLRSITIEPDIADGEAVDALCDACPEAEIKYSLHLLDALYPYDTEEITLRGLNAESLQQLLPALDRFSHLSSVSLPQNENDLSLDDAMKIAAQSPVIKLDYQVDLFGQSVSLGAERIEFENLDIGNEGIEELRSMLPYFTNLKYLKLDSCGVDNEVMAQLRDDYPGIKVVWRVFFGSYHCLTDTEMIWATGGSVNDSTSGVLQYCTDVKYMDLGHSLVTNINFVSTMPKLEVLIIAISWVENLEPLVNCPNLEYLEVFSARVSDLSPLASCTHLQHLNVSSQRNTNNVAVGPTDISSLYELPELKRFYCTMSKVPEDQQREMQERHPDCECEFRYVDPAEGFWRYKDGNIANNTPENYTERYALLREQFGYDTLQQSGKTWSLYG